MPHINFCSHKCVGQQIQHRNFHCTNQKGAHRALCEKWAIFEPFPPMAKVTVVTAVFPDTGLPISLLSPKTQIKLCFHENARLLSKSAIFAMVGGFQGGQGKADLLMGTVQKRPQSHGVVLQTVHILASFPLSSKLSGKVHFLSQGGPKSSMWWACVWVLCCVVLCCVVCCVVLCCVVLCRVVSCRVVSCRVVLCCVVLCCVAVGWRGC